MNRSLMSWSIAGACAALLAINAVAQQTQDQPQAQANNEIILFDGENTDGWKQAGPGSFELKDGVLVSQGGMGLFWHERELKDFTLKLQFQVQRKNDNSGIFVRFPNPGDDPWIAVHHGYEIQIHDSPSRNKTGSIYDFKESTKLASRPPGQWNDYEITVIGQKYTITLNGELVNEFTGERGLKGHIGIQNHDPQSVVRFRNIRVIEHQPEEAADK